MAPKLGFIDSPNKVISPLFEELEKAGVEVSFSNSQCNWLWNASVLRYPDARRQMLQNKQAKLVNYVWDFYGWAWNTPRKWDYDWHGYGEFLKESDLILCPGEGTRKRIKEFTGMDSVVVRTTITVEDNETPDQGYVLNPLREYPDPHWGWTEKICKELKIPYKWSNHQYPLDEWKNVVAGARLMVCEYQEASTGSLTLIEGLWNGVPSIVYDGEYSGGKDYLGKYANLFVTYDELKEKINEMYHNPPIVDIDKARAFIEKRYSYSRMAKDIAEVLK